MVAAPISRLISFLGNNRLKNHNLAKLSIGLFALCYNIDMQHFACGFVGIKPAGGGQFAFSGLPTRNG